MLASEPPFSVHSARREAPAISVESPIMALVISLVSYIVTLSHIVVHIGLRLSTSRLIIALSASHRVWSWLCLTMKAAICAVRPW